jgi:hypothetical protein
VVVAIAGEVPAGSVDAQDEIHEGISPTLGVSPRLDQASTHLVGILAKESGLSSHQGTKEGSRYLVGDALGGESYCPVPVRAELEVAEYLDQDIEILVQELDWLAHPAKVWDRADRFGMQQLWTRCGEVDGLSPPVPHEFRAGRREWPVRYQRPDHFGFRTFWVRTQTD